MPSQAYKALLDRAWDLHVRKNAGYAGADNPDPWANFRRSEAFGVSAFLGVMVRMSDKYIRIENLIQAPSNDQVGESIRDTLLDLSAYALIAVCLLDEQEGVVQVASDKPLPKETVEAWQKALAGRLPTVLQVGRPLGMSPYPEMTARQAAGIDPAPGDHDYVESAIKSDRDPDDCYRSDV